MKAKSNRYVLRSLLLLPSFTLAPEKERSVTGRTPAEPDHPKGGGPVKSTSLRQQECWFYGETPQGA